MNEVKNLIVINDFDYINGGAAKVAINTAQAFEKDESVNVYFFSAVTNEDKKSKGISFINTKQKEALFDNNKLRGVINGIWNFKAKNKFRKLLKKFDKQNTIIHVHGWMKALSSSVINEAYRQKFRVVVTLHDYFTMCPNGGLYNYKKEEICKLKPLSCKCIKCNCDSRNYIIKIYRIVRQFVQNNIIKLNKKIEYVVSISDFSINILKDSLSKDVLIKRVYNPIETNKTNKIENIQENNYYIYVGRLSKEKGVHLFCEAMQKINQKALVIGDGNELNKLKEQYANIDFLGWKNKEEVIKYMKGARALVFPSLWYECAPLTILEALSIGLPCIVPDECAASEFINDSINGLIFKRNNVDSLVEKIKKIQDDNYLKKLSQNSYNIYWSNPFNLEKYRKEMKEFYNEVLNRRGK